MYSPCKVAFVIAEQKKREWRDDSLSLEQPLMQRVGLKPGTIMQLLEADVPEQSANDSL